MTTKLRAACDNCHRTKVRCSGQLPCQTCINSDVLCFFSLSDRLGRPKGTKNRPTDESRKRAGSKATGNKSNNSSSSNKKNNDWTSNNNDRPLVEGHSTVPHTAPAAPPTAAATPIPTGHTDQELAAVCASASTSGPGSRGLNEFPESHIHIPPDPPLNIKPEDFDFSTLLWIDSDVDYMQGIAPSSHMIVDPMSAPEMMSIPTTEILLPKQSSSAPSCACLQQQVDLLCKSKILNHTRGSPSDGRLAVSIDIALALVEEGMKTWQTPIMCASCRCNDDQEVILLAFMSIQGITRYLQCLLAQTRFQFPDSPPQLVEPVDCPIQGQLLTIGSFPITGEDRVLLLKTLLLNTVRKIKWVLTSLQKILEEKRNRFPPQESSGATANMARSNLHGDVFYIQQMFHGLAGSLTSTEEYLERV